MKQQYFEILIFILWFIVPILPAFIIHKYLPKNEVSVKGPFKGLTVDLAGAFAGYFLLFVGSYFIVEKLLFDRPEYEVWTIKGNVYDDQGQRLDQDKNKPDVSIIPPIIIKNGIIDFHIPVKISDDFYDFPSIAIQANSADDTKAKLYLSSDADDFFDLDITKGERNGSWDHNFDTRIVKYKKPLKLAREVMQNSPSVGVVSQSSNYIVIDSLPH